MLEERLIEMSKIADKQQEEIERLKTQLQQKENKEKEIREYIEEQLCQGGERETRDLVDGYELLEILDRENKE